jgi:hypothetical protein
MLSIATQGIIRWSAIMPNVLFRMSCCQLPTIIFPPKLFLEQIIKRVLNIDKSIKLVHRVAQWLNHRLLLLVRGFDSRTEKRAKNEVKLISGGSTVVKCLPHYPKIGGLSPPARTDDRECDN